MPVFLGFKRKEEMYYSTLAECNLEEEENGPASSSPSFSSGISTRRKAMLSTCKRKNLTLKECLLHCLLHYVSRIKTELEMLTQSKTHISFALEEKLLLILRCCVDVLLLPGVSQCFASVPEFRVVRSNTCLCELLSQALRGQRLRDLHIARYQQSRLHGL